MATITMTKVDGGSGGSLELSDAVFNSEVNERVVRIALNQFQANQRAGTHSTKTRAEVSGGGKKPWKQKGTGRARQGSTRSPQWRHGGVAFGPQPRDYSYRINRKEKRAALTSLLSSHQKEGTLSVIEGFDFSEVKTAAFVKQLKAIGVWESRQLLIITAQTNENLLLSSRNVGHVKVINADSINVYDLITAYHVVLTREAAEAISATLSSEIRAKNTEEASA